MRKFSAIFIAMFLLHIHAPAPSFAQDVKVKEIKEVKKTTDTVDGKEVKRE